jgi:hypothetical protein
MYMSKSWCIEEILLERWTLFYPNHHMGKVWMKPRYAPYPPTPTQSDMLDHDHKRPSSHSELYKSVWYSKHPKRFRTGTARSPHGLSIQGESLALRIRVKLTSREWLLWVDLRKLVVPSCWIGTRRYACSQFRHGGDKLMNSWPRLPVLDVLWGSWLIDVLCRYGNKKGCIFVWHRGAGAAVLCKSPHITQRVKHPLQTQIRQMTVLFGPSREPLRSFQHFEVSVGGRPITIHSSTCLSNPTNEA